MNRLSTLPEYGVLEEMLRPQVEHFVRSLYAELKGNQVPDDKVVDYIVHCAFKAMRTEVEKANDLKQAPEEAMRTIIDSIKKNVRHEIEQEVGPRLIA